MAPRTPLLRPDRYFAERGVSPARGVVVALLFVGLVLAAVFGLGWVFTANIDGSYTVDNPDRPPETFCDDSAPGDVDVSGGCDEPRQVERNVDVPIREAVGEIAGSLFVGAPLALLLVAGLLHAGSWGLGGEGRFAKTFAVTAWGMFPGALAMVVGVAVLAVTFDPVTVGSDVTPSGFEDELLSNLAPLELYGSVVGVVTAVWSAAIWRFGLQAGRDLPARAATGLAVAVSLLFFLSSL